MRPAMPDGVLSDRDLMALVDRLLLEQGRVDPLEVLLAAGLLAYPDYEAWRLGRGPDLGLALRVGPEAAVDLLQRAAAFARALGLVPEPLSHTTWGEPVRPLRVSGHLALSRACGEAQVPAADRLQLDLFQDNRALVLEQDLVRALAERRPEAALRALRDLSDLDPDHRHRPGFLHLIQIIDQATGTLTPEVRLLELEAVCPLAERLLGHRARDFLAPLWAALGVALSGCAFDPSAPGLHAAPALARAGDWGGARTAVEAERDWRSHPDLVLIHAEACRRGQDGAAARCDWVGLCWGHPKAAAAALDARALADRRLADLWGRFGDLEPPLETQDFPAWLLVADPGTAAAVPVELAPHGPFGDAFRLLHGMVRGQDDLTARRALGALRPDLLRIYLAGHGA